MSRVLPSGIPAIIPDSVGFRNKLILPWNDLIRTCVPQNSVDSAEKSGFRKMRPGRNRNTKRNAHQRLRVVGGRPVKAIRARPKLELCFGQVGQRWYLYKERSVPKFGAGGLAPTFKNNFAIPIECNDCCVRKEHSATCIDKGSQSNEGMWEAGNDVAFSAGWGQGSYRCQFTTCNGVHCGAVGDANPNCGSGSVIICSRCSGGQIIKGRILSLQCQCLCQGMRDGITASKCCKC